MTSSGFADGLGRRTLAFDREEGVMLERLVLRPELGAFENMLRDRLDSLGSLEDERIARPRTLERDVDGSLVVVSEFVPGSRLAELLDTAAETGTAPGMDVALGFLLDLLPALCGLHAGAGFAHGSISPSRTVLTPAGQIVLLDAIFGGALAHLRYSRRKLWTEFSVATSPRLPARRIHVETDLAQAALAAVMLVLGRPLARDEYPDKLAGVVREVSDVAQIRGSAAFASGVQSFLHRALQLNSSDPYASADDALFDAREVANELGLHVCRRALVDFIEQMESPAQTRRTDQYDDLAEEIARFGLAAAYQDVAEIGEQEQDLEAHVDAELDIDRLAESDTDGQNHDIASIDIASIDIATSTVSEEAVDWIAAAAESTRNEADRLARAAEAEPIIPVSAAAVFPAAPAAHRRVRAGDRACSPDAGARASTSHRAGAVSHVECPGRDRRARCRSARRRDHSARRSLAAQPMVTTKRCPRKPPRPCPRFARGARSARHARRVRARTSCARRQNTTFPC